MKLTKLSKIKKLIALSLFSILGIASMLMFNTSKAATTVEMESRTGVANSTSGDGKYHGSVSARVDEVVKIEVWNHNKMNENSGLIGDDVNVRISIPGNSTQNHTITTTVGGTNTNTVTNSATVTTSIPTNLQYIPGTAVRKYNKGTNSNVNIVEETISDAVVANGFIIPQFKPCWNFEETITVEARVMASVVTIDKYVRVDGTNGAWVTELTARPGDTLEYAINIKNMGNTVLNDVLVRDSLPTRVQYIPGSARLKNSLYPNTTPIEDRLVEGGDYIGNYHPGTNAIIYLKVRIPNTTSPSGLYTFTNVGIVKAEGMGEYYNSAIIKVDFPTNRVTPNAACTLEANPTTVYRGETSNLRYSTSNASSASIDQGIGNLNPLNEGTVRTGAINQRTTFTLTATGNNGQVITCDAVVNPIDRPVTPTTVTPAGTPEITGKGGPLPSAGPAEAAAGALGTISLASAGIYYRKARKALKDSFRKF